MNFLYSYIELTVCLYGIVWIENYEISRNFQTTNISLVLLKIDRQQRETIRLSFLPLSLVFVQNIFFRNFFFTLKTEKG